MSSKYIAKQFGVTKRRIEQIWKEYNDTGEIPKPKKVGRKPYQEIPENMDQRVLDAHERYKIGAAMIAKYFRDKFNIRLGHAYYHSILLDNGMANENPNKKKRRKPWIRYERMHSLTAVHMDWHFNSTLNKWVCVVLDDASRRLLSWGEFDSPSAENSITLLRQAYKKYLYIRPIGQVITDLCSHFYANKRDAKGNANHSFELFCSKLGIKHILCRYKHPQSNGKIEKWFHLYKTYRAEFKSLDDLALWYNTVRPHMSLNLDAWETPDKAFWSKLQDVILGNFLSWADR